MANDLNSSINETKKIITGIEQQLIDVNKQVLSILESQSLVNKEFAKFKTPKQADNGLKNVIKENEQVNTLYKEQDKLEKNLINTQAKYKLATESTNRAVIKHRLEIQQQNKLIKEASILSSKLSTELEKASVLRNRLARSIQDLNIKRELGQKLSKKEQDTLSKSILEFKKYDTAIKNTKQSVNRYFESVGKYPKVLGAANSSMSRFNKTIAHSKLVMNSTIGAARSLSSSLGLMGGAFLIGGAVRDAFTRIRQFDKSMQNLSGVLRVSREDIKDLESDIISVAGSSVRTSNEIADLAQSLITLGKSKEDVKELLSPVTDLSLALDSSAEDAGEFLVQMLNTFGGAVSEAREYSDTIATIRTSTSLDFQKMRDSFQYIAPISRILNKDLAYTGALVGILADNGIKAQAAGRLLGSSIQKLASEGKTLEDALLEINKAQEEGVVGVQLSAMATSIFGVESAKVGIILANNSSLIETNSQKIRDNKGALKDLVDEQLKSLDTALKILSSRWEEYLLKQNEATDGSNKLRDAINYLSDNLESILNNVVTVVKWIGIYKGLMIATSLVTSTAAAATTAYRIALIAVRGGISKAILAMRALKLATASSGIGLFLVALGSAYEIFQSFSSGAKEATSEMKKLNKEMDLFNKVGSKYTKIAETYKKGSEQISVAINAQEGIIDRVSKKIREYGDTEFQYNELHIRQAKKLIREISDKDVKTIKEKIDLAATFSERQKNYLIQEIAGYQALTGIIKKNEDFLDEKEKEKNKTKEGEENKGTLDFYKKVISALEKQRETLATTSKGYSDYTKKIDEANVSLARLEFKLKGIGLTADRSTETVVQSARKILDSFNIDISPEANLKAQDEQLQENIKSFKEYARTAEEASKKIALLQEETIKGAIGDLSNELQDSFGVSASVIDTFFDKIRKGGIDSFAEIADVAKASFDVMGEVSGAFYQGKINQYESDIQANNEYYDNILNNETLTDEEKSRLEKDRELKNKELREKQAKEKEKQAKVEKAFNIASIIANTAVAVSKALAQGGFVLGIPQAAVVGALGAVQLATAIATPIPKFAEGGTMKEDGLMQINDHSSGRLEVIERNGSLLMTNRKDAIVEGKKGDVIHKDASKYFEGISDDELIKNIHLHSMLSTISTQNNIASRLENNKLINSSKLDADRIVSAIKGQKNKINITNVTRIPSNGYIRALKEDF